MLSNKTTKKTKLFASPNRYSALAGSTDDKENVDLPESLSKESSDSAILASVKVSLPPPIFIKGVLNYSNLISELTELIGLKMNSSSPFRKRELTLFLYLKPINHQLIR